MTGSKQARSEMHIKMPENSMQYACVCTYISMYACMHIYLYIHMYVCIYMYIYIYTHTHAHTHVHTHTHKGRKQTRFWKPRRDFWAWHAVWRGQTTLEIWNKHVACELPRSRQHSYSRCERYIAAHACGINGNFQVVFVCSECVYACSWMHWHHPFYAGATVIKTCSRPFLDGTHQRVLETSGNSGSEYWLLSTVYSSRLMVLCT